MAPSAGAAQLVTLEERKVVVGNLEKLPARKPSPATCTGSQLGTNFQTKFVRTDRPEPRGPGVQNGWGVLEGPDPV